MRDLNLPDLPSALLRVALADLQVVAERPEYQIDMDQWHLRAGWKSPACHVCLAGAVLAARYDRPHMSLGPSYFVEVVRDKLRMLDRLRKGEVEEAAMWFERSLDVPDRPITDYATNPAQFVDDLLQLAHELEEAGH